MPSTNRCTRSVVVSWFPNFSVALIVLLTSLMEGIYIYSPVSPLQSGWASIWNSLRPLRRKMARLRLKKSRLLKGRTLFFAVGSAATIISDMAATAPRTDPMPLDRTVLASSRWDWICGRGRQTSLHPYRDDEDDDGKEAHGHDEVHGCD